MRISSEVYDKYILELLYDNLERDLQEINKKLYSIKLLYRWFILNTSEIVKLGKGIYLIDSNNNRKNQLKNDFINSITHALQIKYSAKNSYTSCTFDGKYGNLTGQKDAQLFLVIPLGDFVALQTPLATDLINLLSELLPNRLKDINKPYTASAFRYYEELEKWPKNTNIFSCNYLLLKHNAPYFTKAVQDAIVDSYALIENKVYHNGEVLLYCEKYLLVDISIYYDLRT